MRDAYLTNLAPDKDRYKFYVAKGNINEIDLTSSEFEINKENKNLKVEGNLVTKANLKNKFFHFR